MGLLTAVAAYAFIVGIFLLLCAIVVYSAYIHYIHVIYSHLPGPKRTSFYYGNYSQMMSYYNREIPFQEIARDWEKEFGPVILVVVLHIPFVIALHPDIVKEVLLNNVHTKPILTYQYFMKVYGERFMGTGLVSQIDHSKWMKHRKVMNPAFNRKYLVGLVDQFNSSADILIDKLVKMADGKTVVTMLDELDRVTLDVIAKVAFGMKLDVINNPESQFNKAVTQCLKGMQRQLEHPNDNIKPTKAAREFRETCRQACRDLREIGKKCIKDRLEILSSGGDTPNDMLTCILQLSNEESEGDSLQLEEMVDEFVTLLVAGQETTSNLLAFILMELSRHPDITHRLRTEVAALTGDNEKVEYEHICKMEYGMLIIKETLRLYPPVAFASRVAAHELTCCGYKIPAGTPVNVSSYVMGRMDEYFENPQEFDPTRFIDADAKNTYTYFPFALGARSCIGQQFALIEARILLAKLVKKFDFELIPGHTFDIKQEVTSKPKDRCKGYLSLLE